MISPSVQSETATSLSAQISRSLSEIVPRNAEKSQNSQRHHTPLSAVMGHVKSSPGPQEKFTTVPFLTLLQAPVTIFISTCGSVQLEEFISNETRSAQVHKVLKTTQISHGRHGRHAGDIDVNCGFVAGEVSSKKRSHWNMHFETENSEKRHEVAHFKGHTSQARMPRCTNKEENANITTRSPSHFACSLRYPWQSVFLKNTTPAR